MYVERVRMVRVGPFDDLAFSMLDETGSARLLTMVYGDGGTGKSTVLSAIAHTRPGKLVPPAPTQRRGEGESYVICDWRLSLEDPARPHALRLASPHVKLGSDEDEQLRRREQAHFDRLASEAAGYAFVDIPSQRYFPPASLGLNDPGRAMTRYDVRSSTSAGDSTRLDLTRPCKQAIAYAAISAALAGDRRGQAGDPRVLGVVMTDAVGAAAGLSGYGYRGVEPHTLEPVFESPGGHAVYFEGLPTQAKHAVAFVALPIRVLWAAHRGRDPRECEGVVVVDDFELQLGPAVYAGLPGVLRKALPRAQWVLTTGSPFCAAECEAAELVTLRRSPDSDLVSLYEGELARTH